MLLLLLLIHLATCDQEQNIFSGFSNNACRNLYDYPVSFISQKCYKNPDVMSSTPDIIRRNGYEVETYEATTPDGYILTLFRIPPKKNDNRTGQQPIFIQHGILVDSATWVYVGKRSLAFNLADLGYDVWLGNLRGTVYSRKHETLKDNDSKYWDYNLDGLSEDIGTSLREVANKTGKGGSIIYIGHSLGTTLMFIYASEKSLEAQQLLKGFVAVSPIVYFNISFPIKVILPYGNILKSFGISALFDDRNFTLKLFQNLCRFLPYICRLIINESAGKTHQFLPEDLLLFFGDLFSPTSLTELIHLKQIYKSGNFQKFDFGEQENLEKYGQMEPPLYKLSNIEVPVYLFYGTQDAFISDGQVVDKIAGELGNPKGVVIKIPVDNDNEEDQFDHTDFYIAKNVKELFHEDLFKILANDLSISKN